MTRNPPIASVARVLGTARTPVGTAFLVSPDGLAVTCAHVVTAAGARPGDRVQLHFQAAAGPPTSGDVLDLGYQDEDRADVAFVQLPADQLPPGVVPVALRPAEGSAGNRFLSYGYPPVTGATGMFGYGVVGDVVRAPGTSDLLQLTQSTEITPGFSGGPVVDQVTGDVIGMISAITPADAYARQSQTAFATPAEVLAALHPSLRVSSVCPFRSLDVFEVEHARFFFGRDRVVADLLGRLRRQPRFLAILGPSGSGKSSVLRAGLLHQIQLGAIPGSAGWRVRLARPTDTDHLVDALASASAGPTVSDPTVSGPTVSGPTVSGRTVVAIDQFEEIFTLDASLRERVVAALLDALSGPAPVTVLITVRDDFFARLARDLPALTNDWLLPSAVNLPASLDDECLRAMVTGPAQAVGLLVDDDLAGALLADLPRTADGLGVPSSLLPVIESVLTRLWEERDGGRLTVATLRRLGGVSGSLARGADDAYYALAPPDRLVARRVLTRLVQLGDERLGIPDTRRLARLDDLCEDPEDRSMAEVLGRLVAARLVVVRRDQAGGSVAVELIHDALLREWELLRQWLSEDHAFIAWRQWLEVRMGVWTADAGPLASTGQITDAGAGDDGDDAADLLRGHELDQAQRWLDRRGDELSARQRSFVAASLAERQRLGEAARAAAAARERAAVLDMTQRLTVRAATVERLLPSAPARALAEAVATLEANLRDLGGEPLAAVQNALHLAVRTATERLVLDGFDQPVTCCAVSRDGRLVAAGSADRTARVWADCSLPPAVLAHEDAVSSLAFLDLPLPLLVTGSADGGVRAWSVDGRPVPRLGHHEDAVTCIAARADGVVVSASADGTVRLHDVRSRLTGPAVRAHAAGVGAAALAPAGDVLVTAGLDGDVATWAVASLWDSAARPQSTSAVGVLISIAVIAPDGALLALGDENGGVRLRTVDGRPDPPSRIWNGHGDLVTGLAFSPDGTLLASGSLDGRILVREVSSERHVRAPIPAPGGRVLGLAAADDGRVMAGACDRSLVVWDWLPAPATALAPAGAPPRADAEAAGVPPVEARIAGAGTDGATASHSRTRYAVTRWDRASDQQTAAWTGHQDTVFGVAVTVDGLVASVGGDRVVMLRDGSGGIVGEVHGAHDASITGVAASVVTPLIATAGRDAIVRLWTTRGAPAGAGLRGHALDVMAVAFSPDGTCLLTGSRDHTARLWPLVPGVAAPRPMVGHDDDVIAVAFHPAGDLLVTGSRDGTVGLWRPDGSLAVDRLRGTAGFVSAVAVSPDGSLVAGAGADGTVRLWRPDGTVAGDSFVAHSGAVRAVTFTGGGRVLVTAGSDGTIGVWDLSGGALCDPLKGHEGPVWSLALTPDGALAVSGGADTTVRVWRLGTWHTWHAEAVDRLRHHPVSRPAANRVPARWR